MPEEQALWQGMLDALPHLATLGLPSWVGVPALRNLAAACAASARCLTALLLQDMVGFGERSFLSHDRTRQQQYAARTQLLRVLHE